MIAAKASFDVATMSMMDMACASNRSSVSLMVLMICWAAVNRSSCVISDCLPYGFNMMSACFSALRVLLYHILSYICSIFFFFFAGRSVMLSVYDTVKSVYMAVWWGLLDIVGPLSGPHYDDIRRHGAGSQTQRPCTIARLRPRACMGWAASVMLAAIPPTFHPARAAGQGSALPSDGRALRRASGPPRCVGGPYLGILRPV